MKRYLLKAVPLMAVLFILTVLLPEAIQAQQQPQMPQFLFVQNAKGVIFEKGTITLKGVGPTTLFFSDRPMRIAGHLTTEEYIQMWREGKDSFASDPPNATLSVFQDDRDKLIDVVVKLSNPKLEGDNLTYNVAILEGQMPAKGGICSVFIDIIGLPFTPLSFAGVARRTAYRTVVWGSAAAAYHPPTVIVTQPPPPPPPAPQVSPPPPAPAGNPLPLGTVVSALPPGCISTPVGGVDYFYCGGNFYRALIQENKLVYITAQPQ